MKAIWRHSIAKTETLLAPYYDDKGKVESGLFGAFELKELIVSILKFPRELSDYEKRSAVGKSYTKIYIGADPLLQEINSQIKSILRQKESKYIVVTALGLPTTFNPSSRRIEGCNIRFNLPINHRLSKKIATEAGKAVSKSHQKFPTLGVKYVRIYTEARSYTHGFERANFAIKLLRSIWTYVVTFDMFSKSFGGKANPLGPIPIGPIYTIHDSKGVLCEPLWYEEREYHFDRSLKPQNQVWKRVLAQETKVRKKLNALSYSYELKQLFIRYCDALDYQNVDVAIIQLWGVLEDLVGDPRSSAKTIDRVVAIFRTQDVSDHHRVILQSCVEYRNSWAHSSESDERAWWVVLKLKSMVEYMLRFHLHFGPGFSSPESLGKFLAEIGKYQGKESFQQLTKMANELYFK